MNMLQWLWRIEGGIEPVSSWNSQSLHLHPIISAQPVHFQIDRLVAYKTSLESCPMLSHFSNDKTKPVEVLLNFLPLGNGEWEIYIFFPKKGSFQLSGTLLQDAFRSLCIICIQSL